MGLPLKAIPQILTPDKEINLALSAIKFVIDIREGRGTADAGKMWVTFDDLWDALKKIPSHEVENNTISVSSEYEAFEDMSPGCFVCIFDDSGSFKIKKACAEVSDTVAFAPTHGYISEAVTTGGRVAVFHGGVNESYAGLDDIPEGAMLYLSETPGECSTTKTDTSQFIGFRVSDGVFFIPGEVNSGVKSLIKEALMETLTGIVEDGSIASILTDIKTCACTVPSANCLYFTDGTYDCDGVNQIVSPIPDTSGLDSMVTDKAFLHVGAALAYARDAQGCNLSYVSFPLGNEDPDCVNDTYFFASPQSP